MCRVFDFTKNFARKEESRQFSYLKPVCCSMWSFYDEYFNGGGTSDEYT